MTCIIVNIINLKGKTLIKKHVNKNRSFDRLSYIMYDKKAKEAMIHYLKEHNYKDIVVVSPDIGGVARARAAAKRLNDADLAIIDKRRPSSNQSEVMNLIGEVEGRTCVLVDDIVDTAGTLCKAAEALKKNGATKVVAYATHAVLSGSAIENIKNSQLDELVVTNSIPLREDAKKCGKIRTLSLGKLLGESVRRISNEESISAMFD